MSQSQRSLSTDESADSLRKRVCKACDRCRLKKSKCDGASPCTRCKADNAICVFGERKKSHDKVYPKGYVEMLEQQQGQLVSGLQEMYRRLRAGQRWHGPALSEETGHPLTHDILAALDLLEIKSDGSGEMEVFEDDCEKLQSRLFKAGAPSIRRKGSMSSDSDHSQRNSISTAQTTPDMTKAAIFKTDVFKKEAFSFSPSPSPLAQSPAPPRQRYSVPAPTHQSPLHQNGALPHDPQLYQSRWSLSQNPDMMIRSKFAMQTPSMQPNNFADELAEMMNSNDQPWAEVNERYDSPLNSFQSYPVNPNTAWQNPYSIAPAALTDMGTCLDPMELEFQKFIQVST